MVMVVMVVVVVVVTVMVVVVDLLQEKKRRRIMNRKVSHFITRLIKINTSLVPRLTDRIVVILESLGQG